MCVCKYGRAQESQESIVIAFSKSGKGGLLFILLVVVVVVEAVVVAIVVVAVTRKYMSAYSIYTT